MNRTLNTLQIPGDLKCLKCRKGRGWYTSDTSETWAYVQSPREPSRALKSPLERALQSPLDPSRALQSPQEPFKTLKSPSNRSRALKSPSQPSRVIHKYPENFGVL